MILTSDYNDQIADTPNSWIPDFRVMFQETFPTGNYQNLNRNKFGTDCSGLGTYQSGVHLAVQKLFHAKTEHPFRFCGDVGYFFQSPVKIDGLNCYGGDENTSGTVHLGQYLIVYLFGEYALSRTWAIACEMTYIEGQRGSFLRERGMDFTVPAYSQITILPEIQHTISESAAFILGGAFTAAGRNAPASRGLLLAFLYLF